MTTLRMLAAVGLFTGAVLSSGSLPNTAPALLPVVERPPTPAFKLKDLNGNDIRLGDFKGKVVLLNFWTTWCGLCKAETPWFSEFQQRQKEAGLVVIGVSMDEEGWAAVRPYMQETALNYRVVLGDEQVAARYGGVASLPDTFLIDREGRIAARHLGLSGKDRFEENIAQLLRQ